MSSYAYDQNNVLREWWDDASRTYFAYSASGEQVSSRPYTTEENALADAEASLETALSNREQIETKAAQALAANATFLALNSPTNAQTLAQVKMLTRECTALIRLVLSRLETTDGT